MNILIIGSGIAGCSSAALLKKNNQVTIVESRNHIGGNCYDQSQIFIRVHIYGAHIFHTNKQNVINFVEKYTKLNDYTHTVMANTEKLGLIPIPLNSNYKNHVGDILDNDIIDIIFKDYSFKQWGIEYKDLPLSIKNRVTIKRENDDDRYFTDYWQGIPEKGYTPWFENMIDGCQLILNSHINNEEVNKSNYDMVIMTGSLDDYYNDCFGRLEYRAIDIIHTVCERRPYSVINECNMRNKHTRSYDNSHWHNHINNETVISYEFTEEPKADNIRAYPVWWKGSDKIYNKYKDKFESEMNEKGIKGLLLGRMATFKYMNMDEVIDQVLDSLGVYI